MNLTKISDWLRPDPTTASFSERLAAGPSDIPTRRETTPTPIAALIALGLIDYATSASQECRIEGDLIPSRSDSSSNCSATCKQPDVRRAIAKALFHKAVGYLDAVRLETSLTVDRAELRTLQLGLFQDFVEIHNAALHQGEMLPQSKDELNALLV